MDPTVGKSIRFNDPRDGAWIMARCYGIFKPDLDQCIAVTRDGECVGGVVYNTFLRSAIMLHMAGSEDNWGTRDFLWMVYDYPFNVLGVRWCLGMVDATNARALDINRRMGFRELARLPCILENGADLVVVGMQRADCWMLDKFMPRHWRPVNREPADEQRLSAVV